MGKKLAKLGETVLSRRSFLSAAALMLACRKLNIRDRKFTVYCGPDGMSVFNVYTRDGALTSNVMYYIQESIDGVKIRMHCRVVPMDKLSLRELAATVEYLYG
jgi:hypothetical protein